MAETTPPTIATPLDLPCGARLSNRLVKGAMTEGLADPLNQATDGHVALYRKWSEGGAGMLLTGNVQIDRRYMERPGNVAIDGPQSNEAKSRLAAFAEAGTVAGNHLWMQISHGGRQTPVSVNKHPVSASEQQVALPGKNFGKPRALTHDEILDVIDRFAKAATVAKETGFTGVQLHGAHGYLLSQFLSPDVNTRTDEWGGSLENRAKLLLMSVRAVREAVGPDFPISVKLNSTDFQKGGFSTEDSITVAQWLEQEGLDLLEVSGGTYEAPKMLAGDGLTLDADRTQTMRPSTIAREAYFLDYANEIRGATKLPLLVTGGFRSIEGMNAALASGAADAIGIGRPMCVETDLPAQLLEGKIAEAPRYEDGLTLGKGWLLGQNSPSKLVRLINGMGAANWFMYQLLLQGREGQPKPELGLFTAFRRLQADDNAAGKALQR
ncbi:MAG: NADH:flavin oxidoreductase [Parvibaculum sp.]|jgi:2,4-dienoyl-CoA reductase-like NADH-dependent reductase (Old Yellow Enzyme family)|nr:NADH:flavin oxidoreductase [Parvibaculum sp.]|tara:strand:- start:138 stop:1451 length:1314 start_codon:yes stop_codon:yes gene_type:complete